MQEFFEKYGVNDRAQFESMVRSDSTFALRVAEDYLNEKTSNPPAQSAEAELEKIEEVVKEQTDQAQQGAEGQN